jgi:pimeloyl-ACP methyl ester carboxylesterase
VTDRADLVLLSGLGTDERLFAAQTRRFPGLRVLPWIEPDRGESLVAYAARQAGVAAGLRPRWIGGCSFGGMLALEIARRVRVEGVFLIGSSRSPDGIAPWIRTGGRIARVAPPLLWEAARGSAARLGPVLFRRNPDSAAIAAVSAESVPSSFVRWGAGAILAWPGVGDPGVPVRHVHGDSDAVMPVSLAMPQPERIVRGAGHLLAWTHPDDVNAWLAEKMRTG